MENSMTLSFKSKSINESLARITVAAFVTDLNPTIEEINDIKTSVSEAVTNAIVHGYEEREGTIVIEGKIENISKDKAKVIIKVIDQGVGIKDLKLAREPLYTSKPELERAGMGFMFMEMFMDQIEILTKEGEGTTVIMEKEISIGKS